MMQRAPRPKNEKPAVTIANLERENDNLAARIDELSKRSFSLELSSNDWRKKAEQLQQDLKFAGLGHHAAVEAMEAAQAKIGKLESILCGYRQAIADVHGHGGEIK